MGFCFVSLLANEVYFDREAGEKQNLKNAQSTPKFPKLVSIEGSRKTLSNRTTCTRARPAARPQWAWKKGDRRRAVPGGTYEERILPKGSLAPKKPCAMLQARAPSFSSPRFGSSLYPLLFYFSAIIRSDMANDHMCSADDNYVTVHSTVAGKN
jgi:hypothetical protein